MMTCNIGSSGCGVIGGRYHFSIVFLILIARKSRGYFFLPAPNTIESGNVFFCIARQVFRFFYDFYGHYREYLLSRFLPVCSRLPQKVEVKCHKKRKRIATKSGSKMPQKVEISCLSH